ncbi:hypothetical protein FPANT_5540 [Fusarium pseudoanthophilum]|uniref:Uncharacterized protein n=1 Tax=Fusarium pseudoanthophilum TaxID=48495 RepID=A0A8H5P8G4_9HYPO|nr:hypothetical protein FPANT_5540 [Fusarium pseudoanthophilum]
MKESASIRQLCFSAVLFAGIVVDSTGLKLMAAQKSSAWLQLTQPREGGEGSESDMSVVTSEASSGFSTTRHSMTSSLGLEFESNSPTPIPLFTAHDASSHTLSFAEALHRTQIVDHGTETHKSLNADTQPQYCTLDMLSNKAFPSREGPIEKTEDVAFFDATDTYRRYGQESLDSLSSKRLAIPSSTLMLKYVKDNHFEPLQSVEEDLPSSREQLIPLVSAETCIGDEDGSPCPSMIESDDSSVEDIEVRRAFACPYFRLDSVRHIECLSRKLYRIQDVKQHLSRRHYMMRGKSSDTSDNTRGVNTRTQSILKLRLDRRLSPERQWHKIWETLFNRKLPREGPYHGNSKEEIVGSMIAVCKQGSSRVVPGILRSLGLSNEKRKPVQQLMEQLLSDFQALSDERSNDMETEETEKASTCGGVDSMPMTPKDMEFDFDFNMPLHRSPSPEIENTYSSKDMTQIQESNVVIPTGLPDYTTFVGNGEDDILTRRLPTKLLDADVQVKTPCTTSNSDSYRMSPKSSRYAWECDYCGFEYIFEPSGAGSDMRCFNYPCLGQFRGNFCSFYILQR